MSKNKIAGGHRRTYFRRPSPREGFPGMSFIKKDSSESQPEQPLEIVVVPHTHADVLWPNIPEACINACMACIGDLLRFQEEAPGFRFSMEHTFYLREYLARHPEDREALVDLMRQGVFECGAFYFGPTELTAGAEALIRELYLGKRWLKETLGVDADVVWNVDLPGHTLQMPQIMARAGVKYFVIWKEFPVFEHDFSGYDGPCLFRWAAPDGSQVVTAFTPGGYGVGSNLGLRGSFESVLEQMPGFVEDVAAHLHHYQLPGMVLVADGTDIARPSLQVPANIERWNERFQHPRMRLATATEFFRSIEKADLPVSSGEMPCWWDTMQAFQLPRVLADRRCAPRLAAAEAFSAIASALSHAYEYPQDDLARAWENRLFASEHCQGGRYGNISDSLKLYKVQAARVLADDTLDRAMAEIALQVRVKQDGIPVMVFNSLLWQRRDLARTEVRFAKGQVQNLGLIDHAGNDVAYQVESVERYADASLKRIVLLFLADVPALGYATFYLVPGRDRAPVVPVVDVQSGCVLENDSYRLSVDPRTGCITSLVDRLTGKELVNAGKFQFGELIALENLAHDEDEHLTGRSWRAGEYPSRAWMAENGPVRAVWVAEGMLKGSPWRQRVILYPELDRVDLETELDWKGEPDLQVMQCFPFCSEPDANLTYEVPFGHVVLGQEHPHWIHIHPSIRGTRNWVDIGDEKGGMTLATEVTPHELRDRTPNPQAGVLIQPILLKTTYSCRDHLEYLKGADLMPGWELKDTARRFDFRPEAPDVRWSQPGHYQFRFSLRPRAGQLDPAQAARYGWEHQAPLFVFVHDAGQLSQFPTLVRRELTEQLQSASDRSLEERHGFLEMEGEGVVPTWVKRAEDGRGLIVRCYEARGQASVARVAGDQSLDGACRTDIIEYDKESLVAKGASVSFGIEPHAIETVRLLFVRPKSTK